MNFIKKFITLGLLASLLFNVPAFAADCQKSVSCVTQEADSKVSKANVELEPDISVSLNKDEEKALVDLADKLGLSLESLKSVLSFKVNDKNYMLVPVCNCEEHKDCFVRIFVKSDADYMKYYANGKLKTQKYVSGWFDRSVANLSVTLPRSVTLLIKVQDKVIGRVGIGPLCNRKKADTEIGYALEQEYSGQGIMSKAVKAAISFLQDLRSCGNAVYNFTRLRATAKFDNTASNTILSSAGFIKSKKAADDGYGKENEYFYYF